MPSGLKGYNVYLDGVKKNSTPIPPGQSLSIPDLTQGTNYASRITVSAVDNAGNESTPKSLATMSVAATTTTPPADPLVLGAEITSQIDAFVALGLKPKTKVDGAIVGVSTPQGDYYKAYGTDRVTPLTLSTRMRYGSISKMWVSLRILMHIDDGHLELTDTVSDFISGIPNGDLITIKHLLLMQDGLKDWLQQDAAMQQAYFLNPTTPFNALNYIKASTPNFAPGQVTEAMYDNTKPATRNYYYGNGTYSNSSTAIQGRILEELDKTYGTSRKMDKIILEDICGPEVLNLPSVEWPVGKLYMTPPYARGWAFNMALPVVQSTLGLLFPLLGWLVPALMPGLQLTPEIEMTAANLDWPDAAGSMDGDIYDLVKFGKAIANGDLLSEEMAELRDETFGTYLKYREHAAEKTAPENGPGWMGFGLGVISFGSWFGWTGNLVGYHTMMMANRANGAVVALMVPYMPPATLVVETVQRIIHLLYPASIEKALPQKIRVTSINSTESAVRSPTLYAYQAPGDEDDNVQVPLKVPFFV